MGSGTAGVLGLVAASVAYPDLANNWELWKAISQISLFVLISVGLVRRINRASRERGEVLLEEAQRVKRIAGMRAEGIVVGEPAVEEPEPAPPIVAPIIRGFSLLALGIGAALGILYFLVRFVKWAWTD